MQNSQKEQEPIKISIVVPVYNVEKYLMRCVSSIQKQSYKNIEIILVDDGSNDSSGKICDQLAIQDNRIIVIHQDNKGLSGARNAGLSIVQGSYIGFVDSDDWIADNLYEHLLDLAIKYDADIVTSSYLRTTSIRTQTRTKNEKIQLLNKDSALKFYLSSIIKGGPSDASCCTKLYRKDIIANTEFLIDKMYEDIIFNWSVISHIKNYVSTDFTGYFYFKNSNSLTSYTFSKKFLDLFYVADKMQYDYKGNDSEIKLLLDQYSAKADYSILIRILRAKNCNDRDLIYKVIKNTKLNYKILMDSSLSFIRKCMLAIIKLVPSNIIYKFIRS